MSGEILQELIVEKWGRRYDARIIKRGGSLSLEVLWKHLEQASFHLTSEEYETQMSAVGGLIEEWGCSRQVVDGIKAASDRGPGITGGRAAKSILIRLDVPQEVFDSW